MSPMLNYMNSCSLILELLMCTYGQTETLGELKQALYMVVNAPKQVR
jgi:hypothetical protein